MDNFKSNVKESFRRIKDDNVRMQTLIDNLQRENLNIRAKVSELSERLAVTEVKIKRK